MESYLKQYLEAILNETASAAYYGGTLSWGGDFGVYNLNVDGSGFILKDGKEEKIIQTPEENLLVCKIYLKNKTMSHSHWNKAFAVVNGKEFSMNYIKDAVRTDLQTYEPVKERLQSTQTARLLHGIVGVSTEAGELLDALKKHLMYGKPLDLVNLKEEVSDVLWYCAIILDECGSSFDEVMRINIEKLKARFPEKFTEEKALNRNLEVERRILENNGTVG